MMIFIKPSSKSIMDNYDISEDEMDSDELLFMQGQESGMLEVGDGETFKIPDDCVGEIDGMEVYDEDNEPIEELQSGTYELNGMTIKKLRY